MDRRLRVVVGAINGGADDVARRIADTLADEEFIDEALIKTLAQGERGDRPLGELAATSERLEAIEHGLTLDGELIEPSDLSLADLLFAAEIVGAWRGDLDESTIDQLRTIVERGVSGERDRIHLLLEDYLFRSDVRSVAADRLTSLAAHDYRLEVDVADLFDEDR